MKRVLQRFLALMMVLWTSSQLLAQTTFTVDGINYNVVSAGDKTVEIIGGDEFAAQNVVIPQQVANDGTTYTVIGIAKKAFIGWRLLKDIKLPSTIKYIGESAFEESGINSIEIPIGVTEISESVFLNCKYLTEVTLSPNTTTIGNFAFGSCGLNSIKNTDNVISVGMGAFQGCEALKEINLPNATQIGSYAFRESGLTSLPLSDKITTIEEYTFQGCRMKRVILPNSITKIGERAFEYCPITEFIIENTTPPSLEEYALYGIYSREGVILYVPDGAVDAYKNDSGWSKFKNIMSYGSKFVPVESITLSETSLEIYIGESKKLIATVLPDNATNKTVTWSSDEEYVTVDQEGNVTAISKPSSAEPRVYAEVAGGKRAFCDIKILDPITVKIDKFWVEGSVGGTEQLTATITSIYEQNPGPVTWSSDNEEVATVSKDGLVTFIGKGQAKITAEYAGYSDWCTVIVAEKVDIPAQNIELNVHNKTLRKGETFQLISTVTPEDATDKVVWGTDMPSVVTVDQNGLVTAVDRGIAKIVVRAGNTEAECFITVIIPASEIVLEPTEATIEKGKTLDLVATVTPEDTTDEIVWSSEDESIATVDQTGKVTAVNKGTTTITVTAGKVSATCEITVVIPATDIALDKEEATIEKGETLTLEVTVVPEDTTDELVWSSSDETVATVENGVVTAVAPGKATITVTAGAVSTSCEVTVVISATDIALDKEEATIEKSETLTLEVTVVPEDTTDELVWSSSDETVATVEDGVVTAVAPGTATITVTAGTVKAECKVTVVISATGITLDKEEATIEKGKTFKLVATVTPEDTTDELVWSSSDEAVAIVDNGVVTAVAPGKATITITAGKVSATCEITVVIPMTGVELDKEEAEGYIGGTVQLTATVVPEDTTDDTTVTWSSDDETVATVDENGLVSCLAEGTAVITATCGEFSAECTVTVVDRPPFVGITSLELSAEEVELALNFTYSLFAYITPENATDRELEWSTSNPDVARVYEGVVYGIVPGEAVITAKTTDGSNLSASCKFTIVATSGIDGVNGDGVKVTASAGVVTVAGASVGDIVEVYSMSGACIVAKAVESSVEEIPVAASGVYVVRVAGKTFKVAL